MPKGQPALAQVGSKEHVPARQVEDKERAAGLEHADALVEPSTAPGQVLLRLERVVDPPAVLLAEVEGGVREDHVDRLAGDTRQDIEAVGLVEHSQVGPVGRIG